MKISSLLLLHLLFVTFSFCQNIDNTFRRNERNIYYQALKEYLIFSANQNKKIDTIYLEVDYKITDSVLDVCNKTIIIKLNAKDVNNIINQRKAINLYRLYPLKYDDGKFSIDIVPRSMGYSKKRKRYESLYSGGYIAFFKFDGVEFNFLTIESGGI